MSIKRGDQLTEFSKVIVILPRRMPEKKIDKSLHLHLNQNKFRKEQF